MSDLSQTGRASSTVKRHSTVRQTGVRAPRTASPATAGSRRVFYSFLLLIAALGLLGVMLSGYFRVRQVEVVGAGVPRQEIVQTSGVTGQNIFTVRSDEVVDRLNTIGQIAVQRVDTSFPGHVTIYARLRVAMVAWRRGNALYLLDPDGRIISQVGATKLPIISSANGSGALGPGVVAAVREAEQILPSAPGGAIAGFSFDNESGLTISAVAGWRAILGTGTPQTMVTRVAALVEFLKETANRPGLQTVDLRGRSPFAHYTQ